MTQVPAALGGRALARRGADHVGHVVSAFESETVAVFARTAPVREHLILYALVAIIAISLILTAIVKLDRVVTGTGLVVPASGELYVSPFDTGIVRQVLVKVGDVVKKGQALATLDPTFTHADQVQLEEKLASDQAQMSRMRAEMEDRAYSYSRGDKYQAVQGDIWEKRQSEYRANIASLDAQINAAQALVNQYESDIREYSKRFKLADDAEKLYEPLLEKGYVSKLQLMQASDQRMEMDRLLADAKNQAAQYRQTADSLRSQRAAYIEKWHSDTGALLTPVLDDYNLTRQNLEKAKKMSDLVTLEAPADAIVLKLGRVSSGSVATGGGSTQSMAQEPLFTLVPLDAPVRAEVDVPADNIGFIALGDPVQIKLDAYSYLRHGIARGVIKTISEGSFTTDQNNIPVPPYFKVGVDITETNLHDVPTDFRLIPGMTLAGDIMVGRRTILSYLIEGGLRTGSEAMREP